jgi:hypothetical protein
VVFVKSQHPKNPSSVVNRKDRSVRQKQLPTKYDTAAARTKIYMQPCFEHDPDKMVTVTAYIRYFAADLGRNVDMGTAEICFFCRQIVTEPSKGWYSPSEAELKKLSEVYKKRSEDNKKRYAEKYQTEVKPAPTKSLRVVEEPKPSELSEDDPNYWSEGSDDAEWLE